MATLIRLKRKGVKWETCRAIVLRRETVCWLCGEFVDKQATPKSPDAPSVDHIIPVAQLELMGSDGLRLLTDPNNCRLSHVRCNSARRERAPKPRRRITSEDW